MNTVAVRFYPRGQQVTLRDLNGFDEQSVKGTGLSAAIQLLDRLLQEEPHTPLGPEKAAGFTAADRDRLLAGVYRSTFGSKIANSLPCPACQAVYDLEFSLEELLSRQNVLPDIEIVAQSDATFQLPNGCVFRLPTGVDEFAVAALPLPEAEKILLQRCVLDPGENFDAPALWQASEQVGATLDLELKADCPECGQSQLVRFDMQNYLLTALRQEQGRLARDVHTLARGYGWSLQEILGLERSQRQLLVSFLESEPT